MSLRKRSVFRCILHSRSMDSSCGGADGGGYVALLAWTACVRAETRQQRYLYLYLCPCLCCLCSRPQTERGRRHGARTLGFNSGANCLYPIRRKHRASIGYRI